MTVHVLRPPDQLTNKRPDGWMQTYLGGQFWPLAPRLEDINILDIAASLSKQCRFAGHCIKFYSVAEHCVHVARATSIRYQLEALLHDASEAYLVDVPRPVKSLLTGYEEIEASIMALISKKFELEYPLPDEVKQIDTRILADEREQNMVARPEDGKVWGNRLPALGVELQFWTPAKASYEFMAAFYKYGGKA